MSRTRIVIHGAVQGVGFRPFIYRLAKELDLRGWVSNTPQGVIVDVEGDPDRVRHCLARIQREKPPLAHIHSLETVYLQPAGHAVFEIRESDLKGTRSAVVLPDIATCPDCLRELFDPSDRRYHYPFINCTNCGPRFTIIDELPYDRPSTSMREFVQCPTCLKEYTDPSDRRFHAQPNACPECGPHVELWDGTGRKLAAHHDAITRGRAVLQEGGILAVKGLGGFHLICDATDHRAVRALRQRKHREEKPFALMMPDMVHGRAWADITPEEEQVLRAPEAPIVLVRRRDPADDLADAVPPENPYLGILLPYTPIHHLLLHGCSRPVVATSGNVSDEPICTDERVALVRLAGIADVFLVHNRPIRRHADDSIVRIVRGREQVLRRARGYAPLPIITHNELHPALAVGAHLKNTVAVSAGKRIVVSQHIGDLETMSALETFHSVARDLPRLHDIEPHTLACDLHPDYLSTQFAKRQTLPVVGVQHHLAHVLACMAENELEPPVLGVSWDGTGAGTDGTIWGGEFITVQRSSWKRTAAVRPFRLPGGDAAVKEPRRTGLSLLFETLGPDAFSRVDIPCVAAFTEAERHVIGTMIRQGVNSPLTSSAGRLFDGIASVLGIRQVVRHEGQAAMNLEWSSAVSTTERIYLIGLADENGIITLDWREMLENILEDRRTGVPVSDIARSFHLSLANAIADVAERAGIRQVALTGGCFQNLLLTELAAAWLEQRGFRVFLHQRIPPNDGGIAVGQAVAATWMQPSPARPRAEEAMA